MSFKYVASIFLLTSFWSPAFAEGGVPAQIRNKTITISFNATGNAKSADGQVKGFSTQVSRIVYVSSTGRLFMRAMAKHGSNSRSGDFDPKDARKVAVALTLGTQYCPGVPCAENVPTPSKSSQSSHGVTNGRANKFS